MYNEEIGIKIVDIENNTRKTKQTREPTMYEKFLLKKPVMKALLELPIIPENYEGTIEKGQAIVNLETLGYTGKAHAGAVNGLNKVFVAGQLPLKAITTNKQVAIRKTGHVFDESLYAETTKKVSQVMTERVTKWLIENGFAEEE